MKGKLQHATLFQYIDSVFYEIILKNIHKISTKSIVYISNPEHLLGIIFLPQFFILNIASEHDT